MKVLLQRVTEATVFTNGEILTAIGPGLLALVCIEKEDDKEQAIFFARKVANVRLFSDAEGKVNLSVLDTGGEILVVSQFTLAADWKKGNRPGFSSAADPELAEKLYEYFCNQLSAKGVPLKMGRFRAHMSISLINDGPMTIWMESGK